MFSGGNRGCFQGAIEGVLEGAIACVSSIYFRGNSKCLQGG